MVPPLPEEAFLIPGRRDRIFINPFLLGAELLSDIVAILECTKRKESGMRTFSQIRPPNIRKRTQIYMNPMAFYWLHHENRII